MNWLLSWKPCLLKNGMWIHGLTYIFKKEEVSLDKEARELFISMVGTNLLEIHIELKKLKEHAGGNKISKEDVLACGSKLKIDSVFDLTDAMGKKDVVQSLRYLGQPHRAKPE